MSEDLEIDVPVEVDEAIGEEVEKTTRFERVLENLDDDQVLRVHIFDGMGSAEYSGRILVENMNIVFEWIKLQIVPADPETSKKRKLTVIEK